MTKLLQLSLLVASVAVPLTLARGQHVVRGLALTVIGFVLASLGYVLLIAFVLPLFA
jgi:hypothetical protein